MAQIVYHQTGDGNHIINISSEFSNAEVQEMIDILKQIVMNSGDRPAYVRIDMRGHYVLPIREFSTQLKALYQNLPEKQPLFVGMLVDIAVINVLTSIAKTLIKRESIQYFIQPERADMWLNLERHKQAKRLA